MEFVFDLTSLEAYFNDEPDRFVIEQLIKSGSLLYTYDMIVGDLYEERNRVVGATQANREIERLKSLFIIWAYPMFDAEAVALQENGNLNYSDAVCVSTAKQQSCPLISASHLIFDPIAENGICGVLFTR